MADVEVWLKAVVSSSLESDLPRMFLEESELREESSAVLRGLHFTYNCERHNVGAVPFAVKFQQLRPDIETVRSGFIPQSVLVTSA